MSTHHCPRVIAIMDNGYERLAPRSRPSGCQNPPTKLDPLRFVRFHPSSLATVNYAALSRELVHEALVRHVLDHVLTTILVKLTRNRGIRKGLILFFVTNIFLFSVTILRKRGNWTKRKKKPNLIIHIHFSKQWNLNIHTFLILLFHIFIIYLSTRSFIFSFSPSFFPPSPISYSITFLHHIYICSSSAYWRRSRVPIVSWLELCCLASRSDSRHVITRWLDDRRGITWRNRDEGKSGSRPEGGERMIGMACTKFGSFSFSNGNSKNLVYIYIYTWSASRKMRPCLDKIIARLMHDHGGGEGIQLMDPLLSRFFYPVFFPVFFFSMLYYF